MVAIELFRHNRFCPVWLSEWFWTFCVFDVGGGILDRDFCWKSYCCPNTSPHHDERSITFCKISWIQTPSSPYKTIQNHPKFYRVFGYRTTSLCPLLGAGQTSWRETFRRVHFSCPISLHVFVSFFRFLAHCLFGRIFTQLLYIYIGRLVLAIPCGYSIAQRVEGINASINLHKRDQNFMEQRFKQNNGLIHE